MRRAPEERGAAARRRAVGIAVSVGVKEKVEEEQVEDVVLFWSLVLEKVSPQDVACGGAAAEFGAGCRAACQWPRGERPCWSARARRPELTRSTRRAAGVVCGASSTAALLLEEEGPREVGSVSS